MYSEIMNERMEDDVEGADKKLGHGSEEEKMEMVIEAIINFNDFLGLHRAMPL